jgi:hypothetical protein
MKGVFGAITTGVSVIVAWLPEMEDMLRIFATLCAASAAIYTTLYYRHRTRILLEDEKKGRKPKTTEED